MSNRPEVRIIVEDRKGRLSVKVVNPQNLAKPGPPIACHSEAEVDKTCRTLAQQFERAGCTVTCKRV